MAISIIMENYWKRKIMATLFNGCYTDLGIISMVFYANINDNNGDSITIHGMQCQNICTCTFYLSTQK